MIRFSREGWNVFATHAWYVPGIGGMFALLLWLLAGSLFGSLVTALFTLAFGSEIALEYAMLIAYPLQFIPALLYVAHKSRTASWNTPGYALDSNHFAPLGGALCALLVMLDTLAAAFAVDAVSSALPPKPGWLEELMGSMTGGRIWVDFLCVSIMAPLFEEWLCRGVILRGLLHKMKPVWAIVISAAFFAVIHMNPWQAIPAFMLGCLFGWVYYRTGSLKLTMLMHFTNNTMALVASHIPAWEEAENWVDILGGMYWPYFVLSLVMVGLVVLAFLRIKPRTPEGSCNPVAPVFGEA